MDVLIFSAFSIEISISSVDLDETLQLAASKLGLHFLHNTPKGYLVVVALLFYIHGKYLRSCRGGQLT